MGIFLLITGLGWGMLGFANCFAVFAKPENQQGHETLLVVALMFNTILFVFPGLGLAGLGEILRRRKIPATR